MTKQATNQAAKYFAYGTKHSNIGKWIEIFCFNTHKTSNNKRNMMRLRMKEDGVQINKLSMLAQESCLMDHKSEV